MKVLFVNPPFKPQKGKFSRTSRSPAITKGGTIYYPFWLTYSAGVLAKNGFEISFIDAAADKKEVTELMASIKQLSPELIVFDTSTPSIYSDIEIVDSIKNILPKSFVVLVGTHPSALPNETISLSKNIDAVAVKEYDYTIRDLAVCLRNKQDISKVNGLIYRNKNGDIKTNEPRSLIENLDELPFVTEIYKKFLNIRNYFFAACDYPMVMIITGRGCPNRCFFCVYPQVFHSRKYRFRSPENVVEEFEYIKNNLPEVREIGIEDDTFTVNKKRVQEICCLLIKKNIKIKWYCNVRVDLDLETMKIMKRAGCVLVTVGFESLSQEILNNIHKGTTVEQIIKFVKDTKKAGLLVHAAYMVGNPGETKESLENMLALAKKMNTDSAQFYPLVVYPGTEAYKWAKDNGYLITEDYTKWADENGGYSCLISTPFLSKNEVLNFCQKANKEYYLRLRYIFYKLAYTLIHPYEIRRILKASKTFFNFLFQRG